MKQAERAIQTQSALLSAAEFAALIGCSKSGFYKRLSDGVIGPNRIKIGQGVMFQRSEIAAWIAAGCPSQVEWAKLRAGESPAPSVQSNASQLTGPTGASVK